MSNRDELIVKIVDDLENWLKREPSSFWDHIRKLERKYLATLPTSELEDLAD